MKRSKAISLLLMGSLSLGTTGCGSERAEEGTYTFTSMDECVTSAIFDEAECRELAANALAQTPKFTSLEECEAQFGVGACANPQSQTGQDGTALQHGSGGMWMPMMMGFMAGRFLGGGGMMRGSQGLYRDPAANPGQGASYRTSGGETVKPGPGGKVANPSPRMTQSMSHNAKPVMGRSGTSSRGGFAGAPGGAAS